MLKTVLKDSDASAEFFASPGINLIVAGVKTGKTLPSEIQLQIMFVDPEDDAEVGWQDTDILLNATNGWQGTFYSAAGFKFQVVADAAGATVAIGEVSSTKIN